jgi:transposase-like protein
MILAGVRNGAGQSELARELGLADSAISRWLTRARAKAAEESGFAKLVRSIERSLHRGKKK